MSFYIYTVFHFEISYTITAWEVYIYFKEHSMQFFFVTFEMKKIFRMKNIHFSSINYNRLFLYSISTNLRLKTSIFSVFFHKPPHELTPRWYNLIVSSLIILKNIQNGWKFFFPNRIIFFHFYFNIFHFHISRSLFEQEVYVMRKKSFFWCHLNSLYVWVYSCHNVSPWFP